MKFVNVRELHIDTPKVLARVSKGESVIITNRGKPQAVIQSLNEDEIEDIVFSSSAFTEMLNQVRKEQKRKPAISLKEAREKLLRRRSH